MTIYTLSNTKSRKLRRGREGGKNTMQPPTQWRQTLARRKLFCVVRKQPFGSFVQIPEVTLGRAAYDL